MDSYARTVCSRVIPVVTTAKPTAQWLRSTGRSEERRDDAPVAFPRPEPGVLEVFVGHHHHHTLKSWMEYVIGIVAAAYLAILILIRSLTP